VTDPKAPPTAASPANSRLPAMLAAEVFEECLHAVPTIDLRDIGARLLAPFVRAAGARRGSLMLVNPATGKLRVVAGLGIDLDLIGRDIEWRPSSISEWVFRKRQGLVLNGDVKQEGLLGTSGGSIESAICVPLENDDSVIGVVNVSCDSGSASFTEADMLAVKEMLPPVTAAIERALHANQSSLHTRQLEAASGLTGRTLLKPGCYEARNFELGYARLSSSHQGGAVCERVPLANGGHVLVALEPRADGADGLLTAAFVQGVFSTCAASEKSASAIAMRLNAELCSRQPGKGATGAWIGHLSPSGQLSSCNASYTSPLWVPADDSPITALNSNGPHLGGEARARWDDEQVRMLPGDLLVAASAGALGARNVTGQPFGPSRLIECVSEYRRQSLETLTAGVVRAVTAWTGRPVPIDDLTVLAVRFTPGN